MLGMLELGLAQESGGRIQKMLGYNIAFIRFRGLLVRGNLYPSGPSFACIMALEIDLPVLQAGVPTRALG